MYSVGSLGNRTFSRRRCWLTKLGYRTQATDRFSWDIATFYNVYDRLRSPWPRRLRYPMRHTTIYILPIRSPTGHLADTYGVELATNWAVSERWRLYTQYTFLRMHGALPSTVQRSAGGNPWHQVYLRSSWDLREDLDFDLMARYVDCLTGLNVPSYITMDLRLAWRPRKHLELAVVGQNLLQAYHYEFGQSSRLLGTGWEAHGGAPQRLRNGDLATLRSTMTGVIP